MCIEFSYDDGTWKLENLHLKDVNLLVGRNAVGKSRTLTKIAHFGRFIEQKTSLTGRDWRIKFIDDKKQLIDYKISLDPSDELIGGEKVKLKVRKVLLEELKIDNELVLSRQYVEDENISKANLKSYVTGEFDEVYPPNYKLVLHARRDTKNYPYLEEIILWAENCFGFKFGYANKYFASSLYNQSLTSPEFAPLFVRDFEEKDKRQIVTDINSLGYNINNIILDDENRSMPTITLSEEEIGGIPQHELSQGLQRTLAILSYLQELISNRKPATILIDDLCEGLDYERAIKLGKLIFEKCKDSNIQLIATTNDNFIMDVVDIKYWNLLTREGSTVIAMNYDTHRQLFDDFRFTGLSNFDFFSSDYLEQKQV